MTEDLCSRCGKVLPELDQKIPSWPLPQEAFRGGERWMISMEGEWICGGCMSLQDSIVSLLQYSAQMMEQLLDAYIKAAKADGDPDLQFQAAIVVAQLERFAESFVESELQQTQAFSPDEDA